MIMETIKKKYQNRKNYLRRKLFQKIRNKRKSELEEQSKLAEEELKRRLRFTPRKFDEGTGYVKPNGDPVSFDPNTGELLDQVTDERGTMMIPELVVNGRDFKKEGDFRWRLQHENADGGIQFGDFVVYPNRQKVISGQGLGLTYPEFDLLTLLRFPTASSKTVIRKPYVTPRIDINDLTGVVNRSTIAKQAELYANSNQRNTQSIRRESRHAEFLRRLKEAFIFNRPISKK
uniref:Uncharacterized protein n=1 Tax=Dulem virus 42 TaxID=3145760 RepID=A0AAU8BA54_9CAUD